MIDIKFCYADNHSEYYDINFDSNGDFVQVDNFDTSILLSLYTDQRAGSSEIGEARKRRGYIADELYNSFVHGSKLWLLEQSRLNNNTRNLAKTYAENSLQWFLEDGYLENIDVSTRIYDNINIEIIIIALSTNNKNIWAYSLWRNIGE